MKYYIFSYGNYSFPKFLGKFNSLNDAANEIKKKGSNRDKFIMINSFNAHGRKILNPGHNIAYGWDEFQDKYNKSDEQEWFEDDFNERTRDMQEYCTCL